MTWRSGPYSGGSIRRRRSPAARRGPAPGPVAQPRLDPGWQPTNNRRMQHSPRTPLLALCLLLTACAPTAGTTTGEPSSGARRQAPRTMVMATNTEVHSLAPKMLGPTNPARTTRLFNAQLAILDGRGEPRAYLAETLPQLNTDTWRVLP